MSRNNILIKQQLQAYLLGLLAVTAFALTLPATKLAVPFFGFTAVGFGRAAVAGILSLILLKVTGSIFPRFRHIKGLVIVALGVVFGFPILSAYGMKYAPASHGAIIIGVLPLFTAIFGVLLAKERPSLEYWLAGVAGSSSIIIYSLYIGQGSLQLTDLALLFAALSGGIGYAEGARLAKELSSWRVICYALVISLPITLPLAITTAEMNSSYNSLSSWLGLGYLSFISMFLGFFAWYKALKMGGIAKIGQLQLLQPFITIFVSYFLFDESISTTMILVLIVVLLCVNWTRTARVIGNR
ncbi:MAG: DMT family transporter [Xenococcaceae cyanobacterium MO_188.B29]|nr:DMT family transporter [Xenococcaceae cyanobacterium MO_188.B29]